MIELVNSWGEDLRTRDYSERTVETYLFAMTRFARWLEARGVTNPRRIDSLLLDEYFGDLRQQHLGPNTLLKYHCSMGTWFEWLEERGHLSKIPRRPPLRRRTQSLPRVLSPQEIDSMIATCRGQGFLDTRDRALLEMLYATGARASELCGIARTEVDAERGLVVVHGKGRRDRVVCIGELACDALARWRAIRDRKHLATDALFITKRRKPLTRAVLSYVVRRRAHLAGIQQSRVSPHVFRHSCATHMAERGAEPSAIQALLGHRSLETTQIYVHLSGRHVSDTYRATHPRARRAAPAAEARVG